MPASCHVSKMAAAIIELANDSKKGPQGPFLFQAFFDGLVQVIDMDGGRRT